MIFELIGNLGEYAEAGDKDKIFTLVSGAYSDDEGRGFSEIKALVEDNLEKYSGIVANILAAKITEIKRAEAGVELDVAFSSGALQAFRKLVRFSGHCYRFTLTLIKEQEQWRIRSASWRYITQDQLFPESLEILKEVFPKR